MGSPVLKQFDELTVEDFVQHPVWVSCHVIDYDEPWHEGTDEETFRPWDKALPFDPAETIALVRASFQLANGSRLDGFLTPATEPDLGTIQPTVFAGGRSFGFWGGMFGVPESERSAFYAAVGQAPAAIFPISFQAALGLADGHASGVLDGFYRMEDEDVVVEH